MKEAIEVEAALRLALEALEQSQQILDEYMTECVTARQATNEAITAIKEALQSNEQVEPVAWMASDDPSAIESSPPHPELIHQWIPLYTHPPVTYGVEPRTAQPEIEYQERILRLEGALKKALAQPKEPAPEEWMTEEEQTAYTFGWFKAMEAQRKPLTDEQALNALDAAGVEMHEKVICAYELQIFRAAEAAHGIIGD